jgi:hypothetical protein
MMSLAMKKASGSEREQATSKEEATATQSPKEDKKEQAEISERIHCRQQ